MTSCQAHLMDHLRSELEICQATAARLAAKADSAEDSSKARFSRDLLDAVHERRRRVQEQLAALRAFVDRVWHSDAP